MTTTTRQAVASFQPSIALVRRPDGGWAMEVDWSESFNGYTDENENDLDPDSTPALVACAAMDAWAKQQPPTFLVPDVATYHGIIKAECHACGYTSTSVYTLEAWNDYGPTCPECEFQTGSATWTTLTYGGMTEAKTLTFKDGEMVVPVDFDTAEAAGFDGTGRDGDPRFPYTAADVCSACGNRLDRPLAVEDCPTNFHAHN